MRLIVLIGLALVAGCREQRPPAPTEEQSAQLNEAEAMLNDVSQNEEGPEANAAGPSNASD